LNFKYLNSRFTKITSTTLFKQNDLKVDCFLQKMISDQEGEPDYLHQVLLLKKSHFYCKYISAVSVHFQETKLFVSDWKNPFYYTGENWKDWQAIDSEWANNKESHWHCGIT